MKIESAKANEDLGSLANGATAFSIQDSAKAFQILSGGIYSNKIAAVVRELTCNAHDAHVVVGKKEIPFEVHVPRRDELWFSVKDEGPGLDKDDVIQLYSVYFKSTKTDSNELIGAFGLGSKSPFAYTTAFMITSIHNGMKRTFNAFIDAGLPKIVMISEVKTSEGNGIEVKVPVKSGDIQTFELEMLRYLRHFPAQPIIVNDSLWKWPNKAPLFSGDGWAYWPTNTYHTDNYPSYALQGNVPYDISRDTLPDSIDSYAKDMIDRLHMKIEFEIGDLEIATSREAISYKPETINNMNKKLIKAYKEMRAALKAHMDKMPGTDWYKALAQDKFKRDNSNLFYVFSESIKTSFMLSFVEFPKVEVFDRSANPPKKHKGYSLQSGKTMTFQANEKALFFIEDVHIPTTWIKDYLATLPDASSYNHRPVWIIKPNGEDVTKIMEAIGNPDFRMTSIIPKPAAKVREFAPKAAAEYVFYGIGNNGGSRSIEKGETIFAVEKRYDVLIYKNKKKLSLNSIITNAHEAGFLDEHKDIKEVFIMTAGDRKKLSHRIKVIDFCDYIIEKFNSWVATHQAEIIAHKTAKATASLTFDIQRLLTNVKAHKNYNKIKGTSLYNLAEEFSLHNDTVLDSNVVSVAYYLELEIKAENLELAGTDRLVLAKDGMLKEYPLLNITLNNTASEFYMAAMIEYVSVMNKLKNDKKSTTLAS